MPFGNAIHGSQLCTTRADSRRRQRLPRRYRAGNPLPSQPATAVSAGGHRCADRTGRGSGAGPLSLHGRTHRVAAAAALAAASAQGDPFASRPGGVAAVAKVFPSVSLQAFFLQRPARPTGRHPVAGRPWSGRTGLAVVEVCGRSPRAAPDGGLPRSPARRLDRRG